jgi:hypothetical protein
MSWDKVMLELQKEIPFKYYRPYLEPLILERTTERKAIISAPSKTIISKVEKEYAPAIKAALEVVTNRRYSLEFVLTKKQILSESKPKQPESNVNVHSFLIKLRDHLRLNYDFKKNLITGSRQYKRKNETEFKDLNVDSDDFNDVYFDIKTSHGFHETTHDSLHRIIFSNQVTTSFHPIKQYYSDIESLYNPKRDGDVVAKWLNCLQVSNKHIGTHFLKKHLLRGLHTLYTDGGFENEDMLLIHGTESYFKTSYLKTLIAQPLKDYYIKGIPKDLKGDKDYYLRVGRVYYWNLDDITKLSQRDLAFLKAFLNSGDDVERGAYSDIDTRIRRLAIFFATANTKKVLGSTRDGNRRYKILTASKKIDINTAQQINIDKVHSQLIYEYKREVAINPRFVDWTDEEFNANTLNNHNYESENELENIIVINFNPIKDTEFNKHNPLHVALSATQIETLLLKINPENKFSPVWIARQLGELNFILKRGHLSKSYLIELKNKDLIGFLK